MSTGENLVKNALASGEWMEVVDDDTGRVSYFNQRTHKVVRDLRLELLKDYNPVAEAAAAELKNKKTLADGTEVNKWVDEKWLREPTLEEQLKESRSLNAQYELELQHLRHCLFSNGLQPAAMPPAVETIFGSSPRPAQYSRPQSNDDSKNLKNNNNGESSPAKSGDFKGPNSEEAYKQKVLALSERVRSLQELNNRLYSRVFLDRASRQLCAECGWELEGRMGPRPGGGGDGNRAGGASPSYVDEDGVQVQSGNRPHGPRLDSLQPFLLRAGDEIRMRGTNKDSPYFGTDDLLRRPTIVRSQDAPHSGSYLPKTFVPTNVATSHAPLQVDSLKVALSHRAAPGATSSTPSAGHRDGLNQTPDPGYIQPRTDGGIPGRRFDAPLDHASIGGGGGGRTPVGLTSNRGLGYMTDLGGTTPHTAGGGPVRSEWLPEAAASPHRQSATDQASFSPNTKLHYGTTATQRALQGVTPGSGAPPAYTGHRQANISL